MLYFQPHSQPELLSGQSENGAPAQMAAATAIAAIAKITADTSKSEPASYFEDRSKHSMAGISYARQLALRES